MAEYIDTSINPADYIEVWEAEDTEHGKQLVMAVDDLKCLPPADVRLVKRGRWEMDSDGIPHCTECGYVAPQRLFLQLQSLACTTQFVMSNYCPDCGSYNGADVRGGDADGDEKD